jgi:hypothetical protein
MSIRVVPCLPFYRPRVESRLQEWEKLNEEKKERLSLVAILLPPPCVGLADLVDAVDVERTGITPLLY